MKIIDGLDAEILKRPAEDRDMTSHHCSGCSAIIDGKLFGTCHRQKWYGWHKEPKTNPMDASQLGKIEMGSMAHEWAQRNILKAYPFLKSEVKVRSTEYSKIPIVGSVDMAGENPETSEKVLVELKTTFGQGMTKTKKAGKPKEEHTIQANMYMGLLGYPVANVVYLARDSFFRLEFITVFSGELFRSTLERIKLFEKALDEKKIPDGEYAEGETWVCDYCPWKTLCKGAK